jgi:hypothetical protein
VSKKKRKEKFGGLNGEIYLRQVTASDPLVAGE